MSERRAGDDAPPQSTADRYIQVGWWSEREGHMMPLYCAGAKAGYTPLYKRQWPLDIDGGAEQSEVGLGENASPATAEPERAGDDTP